MNLRRYAMSNVKVRMIAQNGWAGNRKEMVIAYSSTKILYDIK